MPNYAELRPQSRDTHCEVPVGPGALGQRLANIVEDVVAAFAFAAHGVRDGGCCLGRLLFEFDRHGVWLERDGGRTEGMRSDREWDWDWDCGGGRCLQSFPSPSRLGR